MKRRPKRPSRPTTSKSKSRSAPTIHQVHAIYEQGQLKEAQAAGEKLLRTNKNDTNVLALLGLIVSARGKSDLAHRYFDRALHLLPDDAEIMNHKARHMMANGAYDEAIAMFDKGLAVHPDFQPLSAGKAETLVMRGEYEASCTLLEPLITSGKADAGTAFIYSLSLQKAGRHEEVVELASQHLESPKIDPVHRRRLYFVLGNSQQKLKAFDESFEAFRRGNEESSVPYDLLQERRKYDRLIETFSSERIAARPQADNDSEVPIFIVGMPRSGSTLTEQIIDAHPEAHGVGESQDLLEMIRDLRRQTRSKLPVPEVVDDLNAQMTTRIGRSYVGRMRQYAPSAKRIVDKQLGNMRFLGIIQMLMPKARIIHCRRDPMATCFSIYTLPLLPTALPYSTDMSNLGFCYKQYERLMEHWGQTLDIPILNVDYETLVQDQERVSREIIDFCGLEWDDACLRFHETGRDVATASYDQVRRPLYKSAVNRYAPYEAHLGPLREALGLAPAAE